MARTTKELIAYTATVLANDTAEGHAELPKLVHPDFEVIEADGLPYGGVFRGPDGWWTLWRTINATWKDFEYEFIGILGDDDGADFAFLVNIGGVSIKTGKRFSTSLMEHWRVRDGRILSIKPHYFDTKHLADVNS